MSSYLLYLKGKIWILKMSVTPKWNHHLIELFLMFSTLSTGSIFPRLAFATPRKASCPLYMKLSNQGCCSKKSLAQSGGGYLAPKKPQGNWSGWTPIIEKPNSDIERKRMIALELEVTLSNRIYFCFDNKFFRQKKYRGIDS